MHTVEQILEAHNTKSQSHSFESTLIGSEMHLTFGIDLLGCAVALAAAEGTVLAAVAEAGEPQVWWP